jgi:anti-sigma regulatory factor (Ser/Thr protein kinase)
MLVPTAEPTVRSTVLAPDLGELAQGREFIRGRAREAGFADERIFDIVVAASEAMANAVEHAPIKGNVEVRTLLFSDRLEVQVEGPGEFRAPPDGRKERSGRGLGLPLMAKLADDLALCSGPGCSTLVSLTFYRPGRRPPALVER